MHSEREEDGTWITEYLNETLSQNFLKNFLRDWYVAECQDLLDSILVTQTNKQIKNAG